MVNRLAAADRALVNAVELVPVAASKTATMHRNAAR
jgi:hypothetical protein